MAPSRSSRRRDAVALASGIAAVMLVTIAVGGWAMVGIWAISWAVVAVVFTLLVAPANRRARRDLAELRRTCPGSSALYALTTSTQTAALRAAGRRGVVGVSAYLVYGPAGLQLWSRVRRRGLVPVQSFSWGDVVDVRADEVRNFRGYPVDGLRIVLRDGTDQDLIARTPRGLGVARRRRQLAETLAHDVRRARPGSPAVEAADLRA